MDAFIATLKKEFGSNEKIYDRLFLIIGLFIQTWVFIESGGTWVAYVSSICGVFSVVLCAQKKISQFVFSFLQVITYLVIALEYRLYGEIIENIFYFATMIFGMAMWLNGYDDKKKVIIVKTLKPKEKRLVFDLTFLGIVLMALWLCRTDDTQPIMDAISTVPAFTAQILMMLKYKENWYYWFIIDIAAIILWSIAENYLMVAQFSFWAFNCVYGMIKWNE